MSQTGTSKLAPGMLIAVPSLVDPFFAKTVILLVDNDTEGSYGVVLNRLAPVDMGTLLGGAGLSAPVGLREDPVWWGGPVQPEAGMVLYLEEDDLPAYEPFLTIAPGLRVSWSMELLQDISSGAGPSIYSLFLGRASWSPGQLEGELQEGSWLPVDLDRGLLFGRTGDESWDKALQRLGVHPQDITSGSPAQA
ncbi:MAG: YqgE/AlgH family protein [Myxococcales bacterium]|nr:YqgE/AlgH family protein [Myxococcales bacterium]